MTDSGTVEPAVDVQDLTMRYGGRTVLDSLSWRVMPGQLVALLGPNGAGKTTTVECCEGLRRPDAGRVRVLGRDPRSATPAQRARVGVMLQDGGLPTGARCGEVVRHLAALHAAPHDPQVLLDLLGLTEHARTLVRRLSGGQRQRLALAVALVGRPEVLFLDEPTAGLDPQARHVVWDLITAARAAGATIVLTTHHLDEAERLADLVVVVDAGRVAAQGSPSQLTQNGSKSLEDVFLDLTGRQLR